ncbi:MAG: DUF1667 domain-containing protein [Candidatus Omnitrophota bacterium]|nr:DUF1667 domain-containing protein [Candidatus Omnitrophota bacterium]
MNRTITCIECPAGCSLTVNVEGSKVTGTDGAKCPKGESYAVSEIEHPARTVTSTVAGEGLTLKLIPVRTDGPVPKDRIMDVMKEIRKINVTESVRTGDKVSEDLLGLGINLIATRKADKK